VADDEIPVEEPNWQFEKHCTGTTGEEDAEREADALFGSAKHATKRWRETSTIFATDCVWGLEMEISEDGWAEMTDRPYEEAYVKAKFSISGGSAAIEHTSYEDVGVRFKGYIGSLRQCLKPFGMDIAKCNKLSYKIKFNKFTKGQQFFGLEAVQLHAALGDPTYMRERLSYAMWREMGVPAPRSVGSTLTIKVGERKMVMGVHLLTEVIDEDFTKTYFLDETEGGNLYKEGWPGIMGNPQDPDDPMDGSLAWADTLRSNEQEQDLWRANTWSSCVPFSAEGLSFCTDFVPHPPPPLPPVRCTCWR
jgi:hypothetical protein